MTGKTTLLYALTVITCTVGKNRTTLNVGDPLPEGIAAADLAYLQKNGKVSETRPEIAATKSAQPEQKEAFKKAEAAMQTEIDTLTQKLAQAEDHLEASAKQVLALEKERDDATAKAADLQGKLDAADNAVKVAETARDEALAKSADLQKQLTAATKAAAKVQPAKEESK